MYIFLLQLAHTSADACLPGRLKPSFKLSDHAPQRSPPLRSYPCFPHPLESLDSPLQEQGTACHPGPGQSASGAWMEQRRQTQTLKTEAGWEGQSSYQSTKWFGRCADLIT